MAITVNGQLSLCMLAESLLEIDGLEIIQVNTDGITVRTRRDSIDQFTLKCSSWEFKSGLTLEQAEYSRFFCRDVNNYIAEYTNGAVKRKGEYEWQVGWHQNHSAKVVAKAAEAHLLHGTDVEEFIRNHDDQYDFYILGKCDRSSRLIYRKDEKNESLQRNNRYYASTTGGEIIKIMPPIKRKVTKKLLNDFKKLGAEFTDAEIAWINGHMQMITTIDLHNSLDNWTQEQRDAIKLCQPKDREISQCKESLVTVHNEVRRLRNVNYDYYINQTNKLINKLK